MVTLTAMMVRVIYRWRVPEARIAEFRDAWRDVTTGIHRQTDGALGSFCIQNIEEPEEVLTVALWDQESSWREFIKTAKSTSMKRLHDIGDQLSATPYVQLGDETVHQ